MFYSDLPNGALQSFYICHAKCIQPGMMKALHALYKEQHHGIHYLCLKAASTISSCFANHTPKPGLFSHLS